MSAAKIKNLSWKFWLSVGLVAALALGTAAAYYQTQGAQKIAYETSPAVRGQLAANISASGTVRAAQSATLSWNTSGRVEAVRASVGAQVSPDENLAALAQGSVSKNVILAEADLIAAQQNLDSLLQSNSVIAQAMLDLSQANQAVKDAQDTYDTLTRKRVSEELIQDTADQLEKAKKQLSTIETIYNRYLNYDKQAEGRSSKAQLTLTLTNLRQNIANLTAKYNWYTSSASPLTIEKSLAALKLAQARQEDAQRALDRQKNGVNSADLQAAKARLAAAQATLNQASIIAPFSGVITQVLVQTGDRVSAGDAAFRIDDMAHLLVDLNISEVDINNVGIDQPVSISFDAIPNKTYNGVVLSVDQATLAGQSGANFKVSIEIKDADELVKPGMTASVTITVKQLQDALMVPNRAVRMLDGERVVYVLKNGAAQPVKVSLGAIADTSSQVAGGDLKEGDLIILNPPAAATPVSP